MPALQRRLEAEGVRTVIAQFTDRFGMASGTWLPQRHLGTLLRECSSTPSASNNPELR